MELLFMPSTNNFRDWENSSVSKVPATQAQRSEFRSQHSHKRQEWEFTPLIPAPGGWRWVDPWSSLVSQSSRISNILWRIWSQKIRQKPVEHDIRHSSLVHTHSHLYTPMNHARFLLNLCHLQIFFSCSLPKPLGSQSWWIHGPLVFDS